MPAVLKIVLSILCHPRVVFFWLMAFLCLAFKENYPFSNFPMYSDFSNSTYMLYVTDENDDPIPVFDTFGMRTSILKKVYHPEARKAGKKYDKSFRELTPPELEAAGQIALRRLVEFRSDMNPEDTPYRRLNLVHLRIIMENDTIRREPMAVTGIDLQ